MKTKQNIKRTVKPTPAGIRNAAIAATRQFIAAQKELNRQHAELWRLAKRHNYNLRSFETMIESLIEQA